MSRPALLAAALALCGCKDAVAEVILVLRTDMAQGSTLRGVHVVARRRGAARAVVDQRFTLPPTTLPGEIAVIAADPADPTPLEVTVTADVGRPGVGDFTHRVNIPFVRNEIRYVEVFLADACQRSAVRDECARLALTCGEGGACIPVDRPGTTIAPTARDGGPTAPVCRARATGPGATEVPRCNLRLDDAMEVCGDGLDNDCDSRTDEGCCARSCEGADDAQCRDVALPGGTFSMGEVATMGEGTPQATPVRAGITVSPFRLDAYEVTVARFRRFVAAGMPAPPASAVMFPRNVVLRPAGASWPTRTPATEADLPGSFCNWTPQPGGWESDPINCVDWLTAMAFCVWDGGRLPTEAEWEYAARQRPLRDNVGNVLPAGRRYPWGDRSPTCDDANFNELDRGYPRSTRPVGRTCNNLGPAPAWLEIFDLAGNVTEMVSDHAESYGSNCWSADGTGRFSATDPLCVAASMDRMLILHRGGAAGHPEPVVRSAARGGFGAGVTFRERDMGFRCARVER